MGLYRTRTEVEKGDPDRGAVVAEAHGTLPLATLNRQMEEWRREIIGRKMKRREKAQVRRENNHRQRRELEAPISGFPEKTITPAPRSQ
jgi:hypothetical protein